MKKSIVPLLCFLMAVLCVGVCADDTMPKVTISNAAQNIVTVSGAAAPNSYVMLMILNPGCTADMLKNDDYVSQSAVIQHMEGKRVGLSGYSFSVNMTDTTDETGGGVYTVITTVGSAKYTQDFTFYFYEKKNERIDEVNRAKNAGEVESILAQMVDTYSLSSYPLYVGGSPAHIAKALYTLRENTITKQFTNDVDAMLGILREATLIAAYNASKTQLVMEDGFLLYSDILGIDGSEVYKDYLNALSDKGRRDLNSALMAGSYGSISDIADTFEELVAYYGIVAYKDPGFGHVEGFLEKYRTYYLEKGFRIARLEHVTNKTRFYNKLMGVKVSNIKELTTAFNSLLSDQQVGENGGKGDGVGGSPPGRAVSGAGEDVRHYAPESETVPEETGDEDAVIFDDLEAVGWARESVLSLYKKGVVNGRGSKKFVPNDHITRAEFVTMVIKAFELTESGAVCTFDDVPDNWSRPFIASAAKKGIVTGVMDKKFAPENEITREQGAVILYRAAVLKKMIFQSGGEIFADNERISGYAADGVYALKNAGVLSGRGGNFFLPSDPMTRAEAAKLIDTLVSLE